LTASNALNLLNRGAATPGLPLPATLRHPCRRSHSGRVPLAWLLLIVMYWGFQLPSLKQGAAGTVHFEPGGVAFWDN